jgi:hypothetical protein
MSATDLPGLDSRILQGIPRDRPGRDLLEKKGIQGMRRH